MEISIFRLSNMSSIPKQVGEAKNTICRWDFNKFIHILRQRCKWICRLTFSSRFENCFKLFFCTNSIIQIRICKFRLQSWHFKLIGFLLSEIFEMNSTWWVSHSFVLYILKYFFDFILFSGIFGFFFFVVWVC